MPRKLAVVPFARPADPEVVKLLEKTLALAREGKVQSVAVVGLGPGEAFSGIMVDRESSLSMVGALEQLKFGLLADVTDDAEVDSLGDDEPPTEPPPGQVS